MVHVSSPCPADQPRSVRSHEAPQTEKRDTRVRQREVLIRSRSTSALIRSAWQGFCCIPQVLPILDCSV